MAAVKTTIKQMIGLFVFGCIVTLVCIELTMRVLGSSYALYQKGFQNGRRDNPASFRILCLGDSFTLGVCVGKDETYPAQLSKMLKGIGRNKEFQVINEGVGGQNSSELLYSLDRHLDKYKPEMVVLMIGVNDGHNTHLQDWALGQRGWNAGLFSWIAGLRIFKLYNFVRASIEASINALQLKLKAGFGPGDHRGSGFGVSVFNQPMDDIKQGAGLRINSDSSLEKSVINSAKELYKNGQNEQAGNLLKKVSNKGNVWECLRIADEYRSYEVKEYIATKVLAINTGNEWLRFTLGMAYLVQNKKDDAERVFKFILEHNPNNSYIRFDLAELYLVQARYDEAESLLKEALKVQGDSLRANKLLFSCYSAQGKKHEADKLVNKIRSFENLMDLNISLIKKKVLGRGIKLIIMNYPQNHYISCNTMRGVGFIDNEKDFKDFPVEARGRLFAADKHHCSAEGNKIIARNIANYIMQQE